MEITRDVILDLLPLYVADEVSADTRALVEAYLEGDPQLAKIASQGVAMGLPNNIQIPASEEGKVESYKMAKRWWWLGAVVLAVATSAALGLIVLAFFVFARQAPIL
jgi:hypothetical protein